MTRDALSYLPGDTVADRYRIQGVLGRGGFGAVYAAEHLGTGQPVAVKMMSAPPDDPAAVERFFREARITAALTHASTVRVFDAGRDGDGPLYMVMEMLRGPTLEQLLAGLAQRNRPMAVAEAVGVGSAILRSLAEAHAAGLVHRDLKPANIMVHRVPGLPDQIKVLDFGCSSAADAHATGESAVGTPGYMSPEQCTGDPVDARSDLYAVGVILFRCITLRLPFEDRVALTLMYKHAHEPPPDPCQVAPQPVDHAFCALVLRALAKAKDDRFADATAMRHALAAFGGALMADPATRHGHRLTTDGGAMPVGAMLARLVDAAHRDTEPNPGAAETPGVMGAVTRVELAELGVGQADTRGDGPGLGAEPTLQRAPSARIAAQPTPRAETTRPATMWPWLAMAGCAVLALVGIVGWAVAVRTESPRSVPPAAAPAGEAAGVQRAPAVAAPPTTPAASASVHGALAPPALAPTPVPGAPSPTSAAVPPPAPTPPAKAATARARHVAAKPTAPAPAQDRPKVKPALMNDD
ncbi:MAG: protein kinase [Deltaproteobacteria bacterium]|nr:protein kinase [Deltaproteobacteria bacterium]